MRLNLSGDAERLIREQLKTKKFADAEEVILAGLTSLAAHAADDFEPGELDAFLKQGEQSIRREGTFDGDKALAARRGRRARRNRGAA